MDPRLDTPDSVSFYHTWVSLDGIDKNNNGVRDDVEIEIINNTENIYLIMTYFEGARIYSKIINGESYKKDFSFIENINQFSKNNTCAEFIRSSIKTNSESKFIFVNELIKNTILRDYISHKASRKAEAREKIRSGAWSFPSTTPEDVCKHIIKDLEIYKNYLEDYYKNTGRKQGTI